MLRRRTKATWGNKQTDHRHHTLLLLLDLWGYLGFALIPWTLWGLWGCALVPLHYAWVRLVEGQSGNLINSSAFLSSFAFGGIRGRRVVGGEVADFRNSSIFQTSLYVPFVFAPLRVH
jgi:hypothetical protein